MFESHSTKGSAILHAIAITLTVALLSGPLQPQVAFSYHWSSTAILQTQPLFKP